MLYITYYYHGFILTINIMLYITNHYHGFILTIIIMLYITYHYHGFILTIIIMVLHLLSLSWLYYNCHYHALH